jgi:hypothetical protein
LYSRSYKEWQPYKTTPLKTDVTVLFASFFAFRPGVSQVRFGMLRCWVW